MSAEISDSNNSGANLAMLAAAQTSRYGYSWIGRLERPQGFSRREMARPYNVVPPAATQLGNPVTFLRNIAGHIREHKSGEAKALREAERIVEYEAQADERIIQEARQIIKVAAPRVQQELFNDIKSGLVDPTSFWQ